MTEKQRGFKVGDIVTVTNKYMKQYEVDKDGNIIDSKYRILSIEGERVSLQFTHTKSNSSMIRVNVKDLKHAKLSEV